MHTHFLLLADQALSQESIKFLIEVVGMIGAIAAVFVKIGNFEATMTEAMKNLRENQSRLDTDLKTSIKELAADWRNNADRQQRDFKEDLAAQHKSLAESISEIKLKTQSFDSVDSRLVKAETTLEQMRSELNKIQSRLSGTMPAQGK